MVAIGSDERIIAIVRKHWLILLRDMAGPLSAAALPFIVHAYLSTYGIPTGGGVQTIALQPAWATFLGSAWLAIWWAKLCAVWMDYYLDVWVLTDNRIVDIEQRGFFDREASSFRLDRIQDITIEITGLIPTLFDFGIVHVQTAGGEDRTFHIPGAPRPALLKERILREHNRVLHERDTQRGGV